MTFHYYPPRCYKALCSGDYLPIGEGDFSGFQKMTYKVTFVESNEGVAVWCDDLPGCASQGATKEEALENIREAIREYLAVIPEVERRFGTRVSREDVAI